MIYEEILSSLFIAALMWLLQVEILQESPMKNSEKTMGNITDVPEFEKIYDERLAMRDLNKAWQKYDIVNARRLNILRKMDDMKSDLPW